MNFKRDKEAKKEAVNNAINWLIQNELIKYQVEYKRLDTEEEKRFYGGARWKDKVYCVRKYDQNIFTSQKIYNIIAPLLVRGGTTRGNGVSLNPTRRKYRYYVFIKDLKSKIQEIEQITTTQKPHFWKHVHCLSKDNLPQDVIDNLSKNKTYIRIETDEEDNHSHHYSFGRNC